MILTDNGGELKAWTAIAHYMESFPDENGDGIADIPQYYAGLHERKVVDDSFNLIKLIKNPRVGLLNIGEEETKGNEQALATYPLLKAEEHINFVGNVEGRDINKGTVDVVVCDGFVGNVVLKFAEGLASAIMKLMKEAILNGGFLAKLGGLLIKPAMKGLAKRLDPAEYGGALLLGVKAPFIICHGSSKAKAIKNAIGVAIDFAERDVVEHIAGNIVKSRKGNEEI